MAIAAVAALALHRFVVIPWRCNGVHGNLVKLTASVSKTPDTSASRSAAARNAQIAAPWMAHCGGNPGFMRLVATNLRIAGRHDAALVVLRDALSYGARPELYFDMGLAELRRGQREAALRSFVAAGRYAETDILAGIPDANIRDAAYRTVGREYETMLAQRGLFPTPNPLENAGFENGTRVASFEQRGRAQSAAAAWWAVNAARASMTTELVERPGRSGRVVHVRAAAADSGLMQRWRSKRGNRVMTSAWVYVVSGKVYLGSGDGRPPMRNAVSTTTGRWERLEGISGACVAHTTVIYAYGPEGAEFYVDDASVTDTYQAQPCPG